MGSNAKLPYQGTRTRRRSRIAATGLRRAAVSINTKQEMARFVMSKKEVVANSHQIKNRSLTGIDGTNVFGADMRGFVGPFRSGLLPGGTERI